MNKKILFGMFAAVSMLFATSCSNEKFETLDGGNEVDVTFTAELPAVLQTKAFGDGETATNLSCFVYDENWAYLAKLSKENLTTMTDLKAEVNLKLVNGEKYYIVFWADAFNAPYTFDKENGTVAMNYTNAPANAENRDAFVWVEELTVNGALTKLIKLYRPFAQINIGTTDWAEVLKNTNVKITKTGIKVGTYSTFNFNGKTATGEVEATFELANMPGKDEVFPNTSAGVDKYLSMNYILMGADKETTDVTINYDGGVQSRTFAGVPVQRNYRTNIYGQLITTDNDFNVEIAPEFKEPDYNVEPWSGTQTEPSSSSDATIYINNGSELAWLAAQTKAGNTFSGKTVVLNADIDLGNQAWTPIGDNTVASHPSYTFAGIFDGNKKTISNLNVTTDEPNVAAAGLFGTFTGEVKDLTIRNANISSTHYAGGIVGYITDGTGAKITNCHVENATIKSTVEVLTNGGGYDNGDKVGGIVGYAHNVDVEGCTVSNTLIEGYRDLGGIVGYLGTTGTVSNCKVLDNVSINVDTRKNYKNYTTEDEYDAGHIVGENKGAANNNTGTATITFIYAQGVDLGTGVNWAPTVYGATDENPKGTYVSADAAEGTAPEGYCLPTIEEAKALISGCTWTKTNKEGVDGYIVTGNGEEIFMPCVYGVSGFPDGTLYTIIAKGDGCTVAFTDLHGHVEVAGYWRGTTTGFPVYYVAE